MQLMNIFISVFGVIGSTNCLLVPTLMCYDCFVFFCFFLNKNMSATQQGVYLNVFLCHVPY